MSRRAWLLMGVTGAMWGASYLFIKIALDDVSPAFLVFARTLLGGLVLGALALRQGALRGIRSALPWMLVIAVVQVVAPFLLITFGEERLASSMTGILVSASPICTALLVPFFLREERLGRWGIVGLLIGMAGIVLLFGVDLAGSTREVVGGAMVLLATVGYAGGAILVRIHGRGVPPVAIGATTMLAAALIVLPWAAVDAPSSMSLGTVAALAALGAGGTGIAFLAYFTLIRDVGASKAVIVSYIAPVFSVFYGAVFLAEGITPSTIAGLALILSGSWLGAEGRPPWQRGVEPLEADACADDEPARPSLSRT
jgi:drug/metabolite transporter (DMT)-like permease